MELESKQDQVWYVLQMSEGRGDSENDSFGGIGIIKMLEACRKKQILSLWATRCLKNKEFCLRSHIALFEIDADADLSLLDN